MKSIYHHICNYAVYLFLKSKITFFRTETNMPPPAVDVSLTSDKSDDQAEEESTSETELDMEDR